MSSARSGTTPPSDASSYEMAMPLPEDAAGRSRGSTKSGRGSRPPTADSSVAPSTRSGTTPSATGSEPDYDLALSTVPAAVRRSIKSARGPSASRRSTAHAAPPGQALSATGSETDYDLAMSETSGSVRSSIPPRLQNSRWSAAVSVSASSASASSAHSGDGPQYDIAGPFTSLASDSQRPGPLAPATRVSSASRSSRQAAGAWVDADSDGTLGSTPPLRSSRGVEPDYELAIPTDRDRSDSVSTTPASEVQRAAPPQRHGSVSSRSESLYDLALETLNSVHEDEANYTMAMPQGPGSVFSTSTGVAAVEPVGRRGSATSGAEWETASSRTGTASEADYALAHPLLTEPRTSAQHATVGRSTLRDSASTPVRQSTPRSNPASSSSETAVAAATRLLTEATKQQAHFEVAGGAGYDLDPADEFAFANKLEELKHKVFIANRKLAKAKKQTGKRQGSAGAGARVAGGHPLKEEALVTAEKYANLSQSGRRWSTLSAELNANDVRGQGGQGAADAAKKELAGAERSLARFEGSLRGRGRREEDTAKLELLKHRVLAAKRAIFDGTTSTAIPTRSDRSAQQPPRAGPAASTAPDAELGVARDRFATAKAKLTAVQKRGPQAGAGDAEGARDEFDNTVEELKQAVFIAKRKLAKAEKR